MSRVIDALIAYRILKLLVTPWKKTKAYELGIIDDKGKVLIKSKRIVNQTQRKAYTLLIRFVFNLKRIMHKVGLKSKFGTLAGALFLLKEERAFADGTFNYTDDEMKIIGPIVKRNLSALAGTINSLVIALIPSAKF